MANIAEGEQGEGLFRGMRDKPPSDYLFKIKSFSRFSDERVRKIDSNKFEAGGHQWRIVLFPCGCNEVFGDYISVYLSVASKNTVADGKEVNAIFRFFLFDQIRGKYLYVQGSARRFDSVKYKWGFSKFIAFETFNNPSNGYLVEDTCFIGAEFYVIRNLGLRECLSLSDAPGGSYKYTWTITQFSKFGIFHQSDEFVVGGYKWKLMLCPEGNVKNDGCCMSLYLKCVDSLNFSPAQKVNASFEVTLKDQKHLKNDVTYENNVWFDSSVKFWDCGSLMELKVLKDEENGYICEDQCIIEAQLTVLYETCQKTLT